MHPTYMQSYIQLWKRQNRKRRIKKAIAHVLFGFVVMAVVLVW